MSLKGVLLKEKCYLDPAHCHFHIYILVLFTTKDNLSSECTTQKMKFSIKDFFSKCDQIRRNSRFSHIY